MSETTLTFAVDAEQAVRAIENIKQHLLERFPEAGLNSIHGLLLRTLDKDAVLTVRPTPRTGDGVIGLQLVLATPLVLEIVTAALGASEFDSASHGQSLSEKFSEWSL